MTNEVSAPGPIPSGPGPQHPSSVHLLSIDAIVRAQTTLYGSEIQTEMLVIDFFLGIQGLQNWAT
jgi:hypothetical protein